jgi:hypothetical protein
MALQGTIKDFGLADIFQLIGIQRKTGLLTLENDEDTVTVTFNEGQVAWADTRLRNLEDLLGSVLVRTGRITEGQLEQALQIQKKTLQRLGYILVDSEFISEEELAEALRIQVTQIVYRLFRWREGRYNFAPKDNIDTESEHFEPVSAETILMEGARMIDEWPIIERKIKSEKMVFRKTEAGANIEAPVESLVEEDIHIDFFDGAKTEKEGEGKEEDIRISPDEREILRMVDGKGNVQDIVDRSALGEFDTYRLLYELLTRNLIEEVKTTPTVTAQDTAGAMSKLVSRLIPVVFAAFALLAVATLGSNPVTPWRLGAPDSSQDRLRSYASRIRLERIERVIRVFYLDTGAIPNRLELLSSNGYLAPADLLDPWGRPYAYQLAEGSFQIVGLDEDGNPGEDLTITRRLSATQRMMVDGSASAGP